MAATHLIRGVGLLSWWLLVPLLVWRPSPLLGNAEYITVWQPNKQAPRLCRPVMINLRTGLVVTAIACNCLHISDSCTEGSTPCSSTVVKCMDGISLGSRLRQYVPGTLSFLRRTDGNSLVESPSDQFCQLHSLPRIPCLNTSRTAAARTLALRKATLMRQRLQLLRDSLQLNSQKRSVARAC